MINGLQNEKKVEIDDEAPGLDLEFQADGTAMVNDLTLILF